MPALSEHPVDIVDCIIDVIDDREDLLSLAMTCVRLRDLILPTHLPYRRVVVSLHFAPFFNLMKSRPDLASRVRELTLVRTSPRAVVPRGYAFRREFPESRLLFASGYDDDFLYAELALERPESEQVNVLELVGDALGRLTQLCRLDIRGTHGPPWGHVFIFDKGPFGRSCVDGTRKPDALVEKSALPPHIATVPEIAGSHSLHTLQPSLRVLHIQDSEVSVEGYELLAMLSENLPHLEELALPGDLSFRVPLTVEEKRTYKEGTAPESILVRRGPYLREVVERLRSLRAVSGVALDDFELGISTQALRDFHRAVDINTPQIQLDNRWLETFLATSLPLSRLHASYPRLCAVNCWRLDTDLSQEVNMTMTDTYELRRGEEYIVLTRKSIVVRYPGTRVDSQPLPLQLASPRPIPRTYYWD